MPKRASRAPGGLQAQGLGVPSAVVTARTGALLITNQPCYQPEDRLYAMQVFYRSKAPLFKSQRVQTKPLLLLKRCRRNPPQAGRSPEGVGRGRGPVERMRAGAAGARRAVRRLYMGVDPLSMPEDYGVSRGNPQGWDHQSSVSL